VAVFRAGTWEVRMTDDGATTSISFGTGSWPNPWPVAGDWDGDTIDGVGYYTNSTGTWVLRTTALAGGTTLPSFVYKPQGGGFPVIGDWDANATDTVGLRSNVGAFTWQLNNANDATGADVTFDFGAGSNETPHSWRAS
jgi:endoglucanase